MEASAVAGMFAPGNRMFSEFPARTIVDAVTSGGGMTTPLNDPVIPSSASFGVQLGGLGASGFKSTRKSCGSANPVRPKPGDGMNGPAAGNGYFESSHRTETTALDVG